jgi:hypothetical protein
MPADNVFRGLDLRGKSFRNQDLTEADFSGADVRGADFTDARLVQANFTDARLGVRPLTGLLILVGALLISIAAGVTIGTSRTRPGTEPPRRTGGTSLPARCWWSPSSCSLPFWS